MPNPFIKVITSLTFRLAQAIYIQTFQIDFKFPYTDEILVYQMIDSW